MYPGDDARLCCYGAAVLGRCTCWAPAYDCQQVSPAHVAKAPVTVRAAMCRDCPAWFESESRLEYHAANGPDELDPLNWIDEPPDCETAYEKMVWLAFSRRGRPFYCFEGVRRVIGAVHPDGGFVQCAPRHAPTFNHYGQRVRADGEVTPVCAGYAALAVIARSAVALRRE